MKYDSGGFYMNISVNINNDTYDEFKTLCRDKNITPDMMVNIFAQTMLTNNKLPFDLSLSPNYLKDKLKSQCAERFAHRIEVALRSYLEEDRERMREKILEDIYDIKNTTTFLPAEYFRMRLHQMNKEQWLDEYLCDSDSHTLLERLNRNIKTPVCNMSNKYEVYKRLRKYYKRDADYVLRKTDMHRLYNMLDKYGRVLLKPLYGSLGKGVMVLDSKDVVRDDAFENNLLKQYPDGIMIEEVIDQDETLASLSPMSVNTLRMLMIRDVNEEYHIYTVLRVGVNDSITDSVCDGNLTCTVDFDTGEIIKTQTTSAELLTRNPSNGHQITGVKIPDFKGAVEFAKEISNQIPEYRYIGWDIALSKKGWCIVEFNGKSGISCLETAAGRGFKKEFEEILRGLGQPTDFLRIGRA